MKSKRKMSENTLMENGKLWRGNKNFVNLIISLYGTSSSIHIYKDVIRVMGVPSFISFRVNKDMDSLMILPCEERDELSFRVPEDILFSPNRKMRIISMNFVGGLMIMNGMDTNRTYRVEGYYLESKNAVVFPLGEGKMFGEG